MRTWIGVALLALAVLACSQSDASLPSQSPPVATPTTQALIPSPVMLTVTGELNLRNVPDSSDPGSHVLAVMPSGSMVEWLGRCAKADGLWVLVLFHNEAGWAAQGWLRPVVCADP